MKKKVSFLNFLSVVKVKNYKIVCHWNIQFDQIELMHIVDTITHSWTKLHFTDFWPSLNKNCVQLCQPIHSLLLLSCIAWFFKINVSYLCKGSHTKKGLTTPPPSINPWFLRIHCLTSLLLQANNIILRHSVRQPVSTHQLSSIPSTAGVSRLPRSRKKTGAQDHLRDEKEAFSFPLLTSRVQKTSLHVSSHNRSISLYIALDCFKSHPVHYGRYVLHFLLASQ